MFPSLKRLDPGMCGSGTALGNNPQEMGGYSALRAGGKEFDLEKSYLDLL